LEYHQEDGPFDVTFPIHTDVFQYISVRFQATDIGYAAIKRAHVQGYWG